MLVLLIYVNPDLRIPAWQALLHPFFWAWKVNTATGEASISGDTDELEKWESKDPAVFTLAKLPPPPVEYVGISALLASAPEIRRRIVGRGRRSTGRRAFYHSYRVKPLRSNGGGRKSEAVDDDDYEEEKKKNKKMKKMKKEEDKMEGEREKKEEEQR